MNKLILLVLSLAVFVSCAREISPDVYSSGSAGRAVETYAGKIKSVRCVTVKDSDNAEHDAAGLIGGGVLGGVAGNAIGKGKGNTLATVGGAIAGATAGIMASKKLKRQEGTEYVIELDNGDLITVVQGPKPALVKGQLVYVMIPCGGGRSRVVSQ